MSVVTTSARQRGSRSGGCHLPALETSRADTHTPSADPNDNLTTLLSTSVLVQLIAVANHNNNNDNDNNNILVALFSSNRQSCCMAGIMFGSLPYSVFCSFPPQFCMHATTPPISFGEFIRLRGQLMSFLLLDLIRNVHHDGDGCSRCRELACQGKERREVCVSMFLMVLPVCLEVKWRFIRCLGLQTPLHIFTLRHYW